MQDIQTQDITKGPHVSLALSNPALRNPAVRSTPSYSRPSTARGNAQFIRRRAVLIIAFVSVLAGGVFATGAVADKGAPVGSIEMPRTVTVQQGDTLWAIAHRLAPEGNVVSLVDALVRLNGDRIFAGQQIRLP